MDPVTVIRGLATLLMNPALGGGGIGSARGSELLSMLATLIEGGLETHRELMAFAKDIQALVNTNGNPTRGQWEAMQARDLAARQVLEANRRELGLPEREVEIPPLVIPPEPPAGDSPVGLTAEPQALVDAPSTDPHPDSPSENQELRDSDNAFVAAHPDPKFKGKAKK